MGLVNAEATDVKNVHRQSSIGSNGAQGRNRTTDTAIFSRMLYQLSYLGMPFGWRRAV
jgi:hypothetical protein